MSQLDLLLPPKFVPGQNMSRFIKDVVRNAEADVAVAFDGAASVDLFKIPANSIIVGVLIEVATAFDGTTPSLAFGDSDTTLVTYSGTDVTTTGYLHTAVYKKYSTAMDLAATMTVATDVTAGSANIGILYRTETDYQFTE